MENHSSDAMELTRELIRIDSSDPGAYEGEIGDFICHFLQQFDIPVVKREVLPGRYNVMARLEGEDASPSLVYICHMDTVTIGDGWSVPPLGAEVKKGRIYGRGACDMKSGLACALSAFVRTAQLIKEGKKPKHPFVFIGTVDEEDFMRGVEDGIAAGWVTKDSWVLDTEPTNGKIEVAHKGRTWFEVTVTGVTAHASTPWKGADAIAAMAEIISCIRREIAACPTHPDLGISTVTFGQIRGGYRPYVVPDTCCVSIDMRLVPPTDTGRAIQIVEGAIARAAKEVPGITASYQITGDRPYVEKDDTSPLLGALRQVCEEVTGEPVEVSFFPGYTDTAVIAGMLHNHNCMSYGPGELELAHKPDESVPCEDILRCEEVLTKLAEKVVLMAF